MDIEWLRTFVVAAEEENFHRASERLHMAQPTITLQVQKLEQAWGVSLFDRRGRNVRVSPAGRRFLGHAREILKRYQGGLEDMTRWQQGYDETIAIGVSPLVATTFLPHWIRQFSIQYPRTEFDLQVTDSEDILDSVRSGTSDIGFTRLAMTHPSVTIQELYTDPVVFVVPSGDREWSEAPPADVAAVLGEFPILTHNHPEYWDDLSHRLHELHPSIRTMRVSQVHVSIHLITERLGASFLPASTVRREILRGTVSEMPFEHLPLPVVHTYLMLARSPSPTAAKFAEFVQEYMRVRSL